MDEIGDGLLKFLSEVFFEICDDVHSQDGQEVDDVSFNSFQLLTPSVDQGIFDLFAPQSLQAQKHDLSRVSFNDLQ